ncbi:phage tail protein [Clostridium aceticum]|uniref:Phage tail protein n=1 Tax=Clostridium aceticum TaxID=84022 RepID=A0A0D8IA27_9CLOT|nr:phage tail domain-containing protein [Clostridium aceticum]AKL96611.1 phage tail protein [Clostridium aceticum]KJF26081.1 hypothetical protein TZ02_15290 [Clostridium aceticum]
MLVAFNRVGFNQPFEQDFVRLQANISMGNTELYSYKENALVSAFNGTFFNNGAIEEELTVLKLSVEVSMKVDMEASTEVTFMFTHRLEAAMESSMEVDSKLRRIIRLGSDMTTNLEFQSNLRKFAIVQVEFQGSFAAGDKLVINTDTLQATINGQNALHLIEGDIDLFYLKPGQNQIRYTDTSGNRNIRLTIEYRDRWL